jgi:hypothetical protein
MTNSAPKQRSDTAEQILDRAETLIQTRGYSAFSYQDIAVMKLQLCRASLSGGFGSTGRQCPQKSGFIFK